MLHGTCYEVLEGGPSATCQTRGFTRAQTPLCVCIQIPGGAEKQTEVKRVSMESKSMLCKETDSCMRMVLSVEKKTEMKRIMAVPQGITQGVKLQ